MTQYLEMNCNRCGQTTNQEIERSPMYKTSEKVVRQNPLERGGKATRCRICDSVNHYEQRCPDRRFINREQGGDSKVFGFKDANSSLVGDIYHAITLHANQYNDPKWLKELLSESRTSAVLDCGASKTVCGKLWYNSYIDTLGNEQKLQVKSFKSVNVFKFGGGKVI